MSRRGRWIADAANKIKTIGIGLEDRTIGAGLCKIPLVIIDF